MTYQIHRDLYGRFHSELKSQLMGSARYEIDRLWGEIDRLWGSGMG